MNTKHLHSRTVLLNWRCVS